MSKFSTKLKERFGGHSFDSPCDDGCLCGVVFCTTHEPYTSCLVDDPERYLALLRHQEQVSDLVATGRIATNGSANPPSDPKRKANT